ncbi:hypothetical protein D0Z70_04715 [Sphingobium terrigena]|uniref:DUF3618 domain-containing protein n=1 Tax=Sphingobium terrigena TaxID=2304063 RepID=A0A418YW70_9SPHN|nr:hypothetical protein [Sphingobium terrigena]RJG56656.1 hypothetical protein D0Z70_04715 [Sphingobium terrigena]
MSGAGRYQEAVARAEAAKQSLISSAQTAKARITPARLKQDATAKVVDVAMDGMAYAAATARQRPAMVGAAGAAILLFLARRPLAALFGRLGVQNDETNPDHSETDDG